MKKLLLISIFIALIISCETQQEKRDRVAFEAAIKELKKFDSKINYNNYAKLSMLRNAKEHLLFVSDSSKYTKEKYLKLDYINKKLDSAHVTDSLNQIAKKKQVHNESIENLHKILQEIKGYKFVKTFDKASMNKTITYLDSWEHATQKNFNDDNEIKALKFEIKSKSKNIKLIEFPKLRKAYGEMLAESMWEQNAYVRTFGSRNTIIEFVSTVFANNKNIKEFQNSDAIYDQLNKLRFKQSRYKWIKSSNEYVSYSIDSKKDSE